MSGWFDDVVQQLTRQALSTLGSEVAPSSPLAGFFLSKVLGGGGLDDQLGQDPFTGSWYADPFTTEAESPDLFTTGIGSIGYVISVGDNVPTAGDALSDVRAAFAAPAPEDDLRLASDYIPSPSYGPLLVQTSETLQWVDGKLEFVPTSYGYYLPPVLSDAPGPNLGQPLPSPPVSQPSTATGQPTPTVTSSSGSFVASDYNPAADRGDVPNVYVPPSYPPIDTWPTAGSSALPNTSSPSTLAPPSNAATPSPPVIPQTTGAPQDFWSRWIGDATQVEPIWVFSAPDRRLIQSTTHYDSGNRPLNYALNKVVFPVKNVLGAIQNIILGSFLGWNGLLEQAQRDPDYGGTVQAAADLLPLKGPMGLTMEIGPALDWAGTWASTNFRTFAIGPYSPTWWLMGAPGGVGGGGNLASLQSLPALVPELGSDFDEVIELNQLFGQKVQENAAAMRDALARGDESLLDQWLWTHEFESYQRGEMQSANIGKAIERMVASDLALDSRTSPYFAWVSGANQPDFYGIGKAEGFFWDVTTEAEKFSHEQEFERWYASRTFVWGY